MSATINSRYLLVALTCLLFCLLPNAALALSFTPIATDISLMSGESLSKIFTLTNDSTTPKNYQTTLKIVNFDSVTNEPVFSVWPNSLSSSVTADTQAFSLDAGEQKTITLAINPPANTTASSLVLGLIVTEVASSSAVQVTPGVSSLVFLTIGEPSVSAVLSSFKSSSFIASSLPLDFTSHIINSGDRTLQPFGTVTVYNAFSQRVATYDLNPTLRRIPTSQSRAYTVTWGAARYSGNFFQELWREITNPEVGFFTAELLAAPYPGADATLSQSTHFVMLPWRVLVIILGLGVTITVSVRHKKR